MNTLSKYGLLFTLGVLGSEAQAQTFLVLGDSHSDYAGNKRGTFGFFGQHLKELSLVAYPRADYRLYAASSSLPDWWFDDTKVQPARWGYTQTSSVPAKTTCSYTSSGKSHTATCVPKLAKIGVHPEATVMIVEQGTNLFGYGATEVTRQVKKLAQKAAAMADVCVWITAPTASTRTLSTAGQKIEADRVRAAASPYCLVYDGRYLPRTDSNGDPVRDSQGKLMMDVPLVYSPDANNDGVHLGMNAAGKWAQGVFWFVEDAIRNL